MTIDTREGLYKQIIDNTSDAVIFADTEGVIRLWNHGAEALFGYSAEESMGQTLDIIVPDQFREAHWAGYRRAMTRGQTQYGRQAMLTRSMTKNSNTIYIEMTLAVLHGDAGQALGALAMVRDATEKRAQERALRQRVAELERQIQQRDVKS